MSRRCHVGGDASLPHAMGGQDAYSGVDPNSNLRHFLHFWSSRQHAEPQSIPDHRSNISLDLQCRLKREEHHHQVLLAGHSTGGLTATLYAAHHPDNPLIKALWANSPFYDFNMNLLKKMLGIPLLSQVGR